MSIHELPTEVEVDEDGAEEPTEGCRARHWVFTKHNYDEEHEAVVFSMGAVEGAVYVSCGREVCPTTGTPHLQGAVSWPTLKSWKQMRELLQEAYWRPKVARSTFQQWSKYTQKDGDHYEYGTLPADPIDKGELGKRHWQEQLDCVEQNRLRDMHPQVRALNLKAVQYAVSQTIESEVPPSVSLPHNGTAPNEWHWGVSGSGKTRHCMGLATYEKDLDDPWWTDYIQGNVYIDEVADWQMSKFAVQFKKWGQEYPFKVQRKNLASKPIRPPRVLVTSQDNPEKHFKGEHWLAIKRRYRIYHWPEPMWLDEAKTIENPDWFNPTPNVEEPGPMWTEDPMYELY